MRTAISIALASLLLAGTAVAAARPKTVVARACAPVVDASADRTSFRVPAAPIARIVAETRDHFVVALRASCANGTLTPRDLARFRRLILRDAEGTMEPMLFTREAGPNAAFLDFAYEAGPPPTVAALRSALRCWKQPGATGCEVGD